MISLGGLFRLLVIGLGMAAIGCGDGLARVEGTATFDGQPIDRGMISLEPTDNQGSPAGANIEGGRFEIPDVMPGNKTVRIYAVRVIGTKKADPTDPNSGEIDIAEDYIPAEYNTHSNLTLEVTAPVTRQDFALEKRVRR